MAKIQYIKDKENVTVYPVTHERAVRDSNGVLLETKLAGKQDSLVSGTNIKTINNESILGSGNLSVVTDISGKQDTLVSGTNIKTINNTSILGSGNLEVITDISGKQDTLVSGTNIKTINNASLLGSGNISVQETLVSGTNIKTINNESIIGSGNITAGDPNAVKYTSQSLTDAQKTQARTNIGAGTYSKPSGGIPASDLVSGIVPTSASATIDANTGTPSVSVSMNNGNLSFAFSNLKGGQGDTGNAGAAAGFGTISATADATSSNSPTVTVTTSGDDTAKNISFAFSGLKGQKGDQGNSGYTGDLSELEIVNNLSDGGPAKALSAEQGLVVGDYLFGNFKPVDFTQLELRTFSLGANTGSSNRWASKGQHYAIPIASNSRVQLKTSGNTGSYGFFTSGYTIPTANSSAVSYASGSERIWLAPSADFTEVTAPENAAYLIVCPKDGGGLVCSWEVNIFQDPEIYNWVVDDLTTQDPKSPLSANMGYALDQKINEEIENLQVVERKVDVTGYTQRTGNYINAGSNVWTASSSSKHFFIPVVPGRRYKVTANSSYLTRIAILKSRTESAGETPDYATGWTAMQTISPGQSKYFIAPEDALYASIAYTISGNNYTPSSIIEYIRKDELMPQSQWINASKKGEIYLLCSGALGIDARTNSSTFGQVIGARHDANWSVTQYIDLMGANKIQYRSTIKSTSLYMADICGTVFYDENYEPLTEGARTIEYNNSALSGWITADVPDGARYFRTTMYFNNWDRTSMVYLFGDTPDVEFTGYSYEGEKIVLDPQDKFRWEQYATGFLQGQSSACYGKYLFIVTGNLSSVACVNLETKTTLYTLSPGFTPDGDWHSNQSSFGSSKYDANDMFPVLYISQRNNPQRAQIQVYRIIPTLTDDEISSFTMTLVQTIWLPAQSNFNSLGYPNVTIDTENNKMWAYSRNNDSSGDTYGKATFTMFNIPALFSDGNPVTTVTLEDTDAKDRFRDNWSIYDNQGSFIHRGKLYMARGTGSDGICEINVIDLYYKRTRVSRLTMYDAGARFEPEGCFYYQSSIFFNAGSGIYKVILSD